MRCEILTLFPGMISPVLDESILKRAQAKGLLNARIINIRDFTFDKHRTADDYPYGGGAGMVLKAEPVLKAVDFIREEEEDLRVLLMSPQGKRYNQGMASELSREERRIVFICGHYEGIDERVKTYLSPEEISIGDYVMTGGELAALVIIDSVVRLIPGVLGDSSSVEDESFNQLLDYPHYTRPARLREMDVPSVLISGNHEVIRQWKRKQSVTNTFNKRPDMLDETVLSEEDMKILKEIKEESEK